MDESSRPHLEAAAQLAKSNGAKAQIAYFQRYLDWVRLFAAAQAVRANGDASALARRLEVDAIRAFSQAALALGPTAGERLSLDGAPVNSRRRLNVLAK